MSEFNKSVTKNLDVPVTVAVDAKWISSVDEPALPTGYTRAVELDIDLGIIGKWWAFLKVS